jgi:sortase (surface protein transpeptidase)
MKATILTYVKNYLDQRMQTSLDAMNAAQESANGESKSSAGDKYETSRAMGHLDRDMHARMYQQTREERKLIERIDGNIDFKKGALGAFISTSMGDFFLSVSIGQVKIDEKPIMIISPQSPIGALLMGKMVADKFNFRGKEAEILAIE